ncbi:MAG TPA: SagB/ThcOx family dehydrogenase [Solirubrobacteraceae bacterium]|jgi:SagB-type dehydrogenase family enzyme|nr:SagB/ThcOx family dehydrogenase [Solirubrobacteraceae bacterium]
MNVSHTSDRAWLPLLTIRPSPEPDESDLLISDPLQLRRSRVNRAAFLDLLAAELHRKHPRGDAQRLAGELDRRGWRPSREIEPVTLKAIRTWWARGWHPSLEYFLWSRNRPYIDAADTTGEVRRKTVSTYRVSGEPPPRLVPKGRLLALPAPMPLDGTQTLGQVLMSRRTVRTYDPRPVPASLLSTVLTHGLEDVRTRRTGRLEDQLDYLKTHGIAFDFYLVAYSVEGVPAGVWFYELIERSLVCVQQGDFRNTMRSILVGMKAPKTAAWTLVISADFAQYQWRYRHERALRHIYMAAGRVAQRLIVVAQAFGLGTLPTPATHDAAIIKLLRLDHPRQSPVYTLTTGHLTARDRVDV